MKKLIASIAALAALSSIAGVAHADVTHLTSRHDTTSELKRLEQAGYNPAHNSNNYPDDIQDAEAKIHAQDGVAANGAAVDNSGYGNAPSAMSQGGSTTAHVGVRGGLYSHN
ncbi:MAG: DUF4148 domain-containing protein [Burkholderia sp.]